MEEPVQCLGSDKWSSGWQLCHDTPGEPLEKLLNISDLLFSHPKHEVSKTYLLGWLRTE